MPSKGGSDPVSGCIYIDKWGEMCLYPFLINTQREINLLLPYSTSLLRALEVIIARFQVVVIMNWN